jgi:hypothetical protein
VKDDQSGRLVGGACAPEPGPRRDDQQRRSQGEARANAPTPRAGARASGRRKESRRMQGIAHHAFDERVRHVIRRLRA